MKSMALTGIRQLGMIERPAPVIKNEKDVLIKLLYTGICGSDIHIYSKGQIGGTQVEFPYVIGHEGCGVVLDTGNAVSRMKKGDLIAIEPAISCGICDQCIEGRHNTCRNLTFLGSPGQSEGLLSEMIIMPEECCYLLPEGLDPELGCFAEPLSIGIYAAKLAGTLHNKKIAILGSGPIGMSVMLYSKTLKVSKVYATDLIDERLDLAIKSGADCVGNPERHDICSMILAAEPQGVDLVFECCGKQEAMDQAVEILKPGGKILIVGIPEFDNWIFAAEQIRRKEITLVNVRRQNNCLQMAIDLIADGSIDVPSLITHEFPFSRTAEAFELVSAYRDGVMKALIKM